LPEQHGRSWRLVEGHGSLGKVMEPCGAWWRIKEARRRSYDMIRTSSDLSTVNV